MDLGLSGAKVIVTAGASGIGREIVQAFVEEGAEVSICDVDRMALGVLRAEMPGVHVTHCDVSNAKETEVFIHDAARQMGGLDALINNAGIGGPTAKVEDMDPHEWSRCLDICLTGQFNCARVAIPYLRDSGNGSITNMSSAAGSRGFAMRSAYAAAKWGVVGFTKSLSIELGPDNIRANAVLPGIVAGARQRRVMEARAQARGMAMREVEEEAFSFTSLKDYVTPRQLADQILFLTSTRGRMISGQAISVDGDLQKLG